ncbi:MAG: hypothetical protein EXR73_10020 [Myxococcales bacterium]|nr:hypothetical protein [Myxococcales bacterium]
MTQRMLGFMTGAVVLALALPAHAERADGGNWFDEEFGWPRGVERAPQGLGGQRRARDLGEVQQEVRHLQQGHGREQRVDPTLGSLRKVAELDPTNAEVTKAIDELAARNAGYEKQRDERLAKVQCPSKDAM